MKYKIVGSRSVAGFPPGSTLGVDDLDGCNLEMLLEAGHLAVVQVHTRAVKATSAEADEAEQSQED